MDSAHAPHTPEPPGRSESPERSDVPPAAGAAGVTATRPRLPAWARALLPMLLFLPAASTSMIVLLIPGYQSVLARDDAWSVLAYGPMAGVVLATYLVLAWGLIRWVDRRPARDLGLRLDRRALLGLLAGCGIALLIAVVGGVLASVFDLGRDSALVAADAAPAWTASAVAQVVIMIALQAFVLQGIGEEVLFRGYLLQSLRTRPLLALLVSTVAFTIPHLASGGGQQSALEHVLYLAIPFGFSVSAALLAIRLRSVWAAVGIHGGFHLGTALAVVLGLPVDGPGTWIVAGVLHLGAGILIGLSIPTSRWQEMRVAGPYAGR